MKQSLLSLLLLCYITGFTQNQTNTLPAILTKTGTSISNPQRKHFQGKETIIWQEDFAQGIPANWKNEGFIGNMSPSSLCKWEYRGPNTSPSNSIGSRGAYANPNDPITSPTANNGFIIFDSDYLDNDGVVGNFGNGNAPAPHIGMLTTDTIDLSSYNHVGIEFTQYARRFAGFFKLYISIDGGLSWNDSILFNSGLFTSQSTPTNEIVRKNLSAIIGGQTNVMLRFAFDGRPNNNNSNGYYFWMLDDISLYEIPPHELSFENPRGSFPFDVIFNNDTTAIKYFHLPFKQIQPIKFKGRINNTGYYPQTFVQLNVDIIDSNQQLLTTLQSTPAGYAILNGSFVPDSLSVTLTNYIPTSKGNYKFVYYATSDSILKGDPGMPSDTFDIDITDSVMSLDNKTLANGIGTNEIGNDNSSIGIRLDFQNQEVLYGAEIILSPDCHSGGKIEVSFYDTTGFDLTVGFQKPAEITVKHTITKQDSANGKIIVDFTTSNIPIPVAGSSCYLVVKMFSNNGLNPISIANDQNWIQPPFASIFYYTLNSPNRWYTGFTGSLIINSPMIRGLTCSFANAVWRNCYLSLKENPTSPPYIVAMNQDEKQLIIKSKKSLNIPVNIKLVDMTGRAVITNYWNPSEEDDKRLDLHFLSKGIYSLQLEQGQEVIPYKIVIQ